MITLVGTTCMSSAGRRGVNLGIITTVFNRGKDNPLLLKNQGIFFAFEKSR
jgi:hypothetical protein